MDKSQKISDELIGFMNGGTIYVSIDGGKKIKATVGQYAGNVSLTYYDEHNLKTVHDLGISMYNPLGFVAAMGLCAADKLPMVDFTYNIDSGSKNN